MKVVQQITSDLLKSAQVHHVECQRCRSLVGLVLTDQSLGDEPVIVPVGSKLLAIRERLDKTPDGEHMIGFQCECGNDTRISEAELHHEPDDGWRGDVRTNAELKRIEKAIDKCDEHEADYESNKDMTRYETFTVKRA
jgi:hypothetical protein